SHVTGLAIKGGIPSFLLQIVVVGVTFFTIFTGIKEARDSDLGGTMTFGQGFRAGAQMAGIAGIMAAAFTLIYLTVIDPNVGEKAMEIMREQWEKAGMSEDQQEMASKWSGWMFKPGLATGFTLFWITLWGFIKALIASAILKKDTLMQTPVS